MRLPIASLSKLNRIEKRANKGPFLFLAANAKTELAAESLTLHDGSLIYLPQCHLAL
jgi:hypothetical protein